LRELTLSFLAEGLLDHSLMFGYGWFGL